MTAYVDSSAVAKMLLTDEDARDELLTILSTAGTIATSRLTYVETRAALASARRSSRISAGGHDAAITAFEVIWSTFVVVDLTQEIAEDACLVAEVFGLRAGDAIQLASLRQMGPDPVPMVVWDERLRAAAAASGHPIYPQAL